MRLKSLSLAAALIAVPSAVWAQTDQQFRQCNGTDPALAIIGCTAVIEARNTPALTRSHALTNRGLAYLARMQNDRALPDFENAIRLDPKDPLALLGRANYY